MPYSSWKYEWTIALSAADSTESYSMISAMYPLSPCPPPSALNAEMLVAVKLCAVLDVASRVPLMYDCALFESFETAVITYHVLSASAVVPIVSSMRNAVPWTAIVTLPFVPIPVCRPPTVPVVDCTAVCVFILMTMNRVTAVPSGVDAFVIASAATASMTGLPFGRNAPLERYTGVPSGTVIGYRVPVTFVSVHDVTVPPSAGGDSMVLTRHRPRIPPTAVGSWNCGNLGARTIDCGSGGVSI
jgi:hypothetical protein